MIESFARTYEGLKLERAAQSGLPTLGFARTYEGLKQQLRHVPKQSLNSGFARTYEGLKLREREQYEAWVHAFCPYL